MNFVPSFKLKSGSKAENDSHKKKSDLAWRAWLFAYANDAKKTVGKGKGPKAGWELAAKQSIDACRFGQVCNLYSLNETNSTFSCHAFDTNICCQMPVSAPNRSETRSPFKNMTVLVIIIDLCLAVKNHIAAKTIRFCRNLLRRKRVGHPAFESNIHISIFSQLS